MAICMDRVASPRRGGTWWWLYRQDYKSGEEMKKEEYEE